MALQARVTQSYLEAIQSGSPKVRATQFYTEVISDPTTTGGVAVPDGDSDGQYPLDGSDPTLDGSDLSISQNTTAATRSGAAFRFTNITVPAGATITGARMLLTLVDGTNNDLYANVYGLAHDNIPAFGTGSLAPASYDKTSASLSFSEDNVGIAGAGYDITPLVAVVQEIVDRSGWESGNAMAFVMEGTDGSVKTFKVKSKDGGSNEAELFIAYTEAAEVPVLSTKTSIGVSIGL